MFRHALCILSLALLTACGRIPLPFFEPAPVPAPDAPAQKQEPAYVSVSPEARAYLEEAQKYWTESGECTHPAQALFLLDKAVSADPLDPAPLLLRSLALSELGYLNDAFLDATKAIRLRPTAEAYATRGLICLKQNQPQGAGRDFSYAEKLDPNEPLIYVYRAAGAFLGDRRKDACNDLEKACSLGTCLPWEKAKREKVCR